MAEQDHALLVGICRYKDHKRLSPLAGPMNDVNRVRRWLIDDQGVPEKQIKELKTPGALLQEPPAEGWASDTDWTPNGVGFQKTYQSIVYGPDGKVVPREGRLYMYFSGHGFALAQEDDDAQAALFGADTIGDIHSNLPGSVYAAAARKARAFKEVVLIMDCCRDLMDNRSYSDPGVSTIERSNSDKTVKMFELYAAPREGKSQERQLADSEGAVVGVMTDAMLRALKLAPADLTGQVASGVMARVMQYNWARWYPTPPRPPAPNAIWPKNGDIYFKSRREDLVSVTVSRAKGLEPGSTLELRSTAWTAEATVSDSTLAWTEKQGAWAHDVALSGATGGPQHFKLMLPPGPHVLVVDAQTFAFDPGVSNAVAI
jgi:hypothetical protein